MRHRPLITIRQDTDTPARREVTPGAILTYLYDRSRDSRQNNAPGQDFIAYAYDDVCLAFAVCDGVSQSFYGDLAARFLGERLVTWLQGLPSDLSAEHIETALDRALREWVGDATALVEAKELTAGLAPMLRKALERKRANGSETMFVAGRIDLERRQLVACWMGDMRLWLCDRAGTLRSPPGAVWETRERWSSRVGPKNGPPHAAIMPLDGIARVIIHSDGIGSKAAELGALSLEKLDALARELDMLPASDDISLLDIALELPDEVDIILDPLPTPAPYQPDPGEPIIQWAAVDGAEWYRVEIADSLTLEVEGTTFFVPQPAHPTHPVVCRVQALASHRLPSAWSAPIAVAFPAAEIEAEAQAPVGEAATAVEAELPGVEMEEMIGAAAEGEFRTGAIMALALVIAAAITVWWYISNVVGAG